MIAIRPGRFRIAGVGARTLTIGMLGCGVVGGGVAARLLAADALAGVPIRLARVLVRDLRKPRYPEAVVSHLTTHAAEILDDPEVGVVVEAIGGIEPARSYVLAALRSGKHVVTANKALVSTYGRELTAAADEGRASLRYEASVAGAIPIVRILGEILAPEDVIEIAGVLNGTSNFVLQQMRDGCEFDEAVRRAQAAGYAEADPSDDVDGLDAARKLSVLAPLAFRRRVAAEAIARRSLRTLSRRDFAAARELGGSIVQLALLRKSARGIEALVSPALVRENHEFARLQGPENIVRVITKHAGTLRFSGHGAGRDATASAVVSDLAEVARRHVGLQAQFAAVINFPEVKPMRAELALLGSLSTFENLDSEQIAEVIDR